MALGGWLRHTYIMADDADQRLTTVFEMLYRGATVTECASASGMHKGTVSKIRRGNTRRGVLYRQYCERMDAGTSRTSNVVSIGHEERRRRREGGTRNDRAPQPAKLGADADSLDAGDRARLADFLGAFKLSGNLQASCLWAGATAEDLARWCVLADVRADVKKAGADAFLRSMKTLHQVANGKTATGDDDRRATPASRMRAAVAVIEAGDLARPDARTIKDVVADGQRSNATPVELLTAAVLEKFGQFARTDLMTGIEIDAG